MAIHSQQQQQRPPREKPRRRPVHGFGVASMMSGGIDVYTGDQIARAQDILTTSACRTKMMIVGDAGVGKTSTVVAFTSGSAYRSDDIQITRPTTSIDIATIRVCYNDGTSIYLDVYDTAGTERYWSIPPSLLRDLDVVIYMCSADTQDKVKSVAQWIECTRALDAKSVPIRIVACNKMDLVGEQARDDVAQTLHSIASAYELSSMWLISAKTSENVANLMCAAAVAARVKRDSASARLAAERAVDVNWTDLTPILEPDGDDKDDGHGGWVGGLPDVVEVSDPDLAHARVSRPLLPDGTVAYGSSYISVGRRHHHHPQDVQPTSSGCLC